MSKEIYLYSEDKKYKCAVELADSCDRFGCPGHSMIILTEERPDGTYVIAQARDKILETEKDKQIADLQHRLKVADIALEKACKRLQDYYCTTCDNQTNCSRVEMCEMCLSTYLPSDFKEQAESELKGE